MRGRQARVLSTGVANLGPDASLAGGSLTAPNGLFVGGGNLLHGHGTVNARVSAGIGSLIAAEGGNLTIGSATSPAGFFSDGDLTTGTNTVTINDANDAVLGSLTTLGDGLNDGTLVAGTAVPLETRTHFLIEQGKNLVGRGHVVGNVKNHGSVIGDGPSLIPNERIVFDAGWKVSGIGDFANVLFNGTFAPGLSPGVVAGSDLAIGGTLEIELGGATAGNGIGHHDQVNDANMFTIAAGAALALQPYGGFLPTLGQEFTIVTAAAGFAGEFANVTVDPWFWQHGIGFQLSTTSNSLVITAVAPHLSGDFNLDGSIDAADYIVWRHGLGTTYSQADLAEWRANFGKSFSTGNAFGNTAVPEPGVIAVVFLAIAAFSSQRRRVGGAA